MSEQKQSVPNNNPVPSINPEEYFSFEGFEDGEFQKVSDDSSVHLERYTIDQKSKKEQDILFSGNFDNIDVWLKHEEFRLKKANGDSERELREKNANRSFWFSAVWAGFIVFLITLHALCPLDVLTETEFITVIGTLTATILTYYLLVIKYLFYRPNSKNE